MSEGVVIVGAGAGGDAAAIGLRKLGYEGRITLVGNEGHPPYERPHLSKQFLRRDIPDEKVFLRPHGEYERQGIDLRLESWVTGADREKRRVTLTSDEQLPFEQLVLATGASPRRLAGVPEANNVFTLRSLDDAVALREAIDGAERVVMVGAGFIGAEIAASARKLDKNVVMIEAAEVPLERVLGVDLGRHYAGIHRDHGVDVRTGTTVNSWIAEDDHVLAANLSDGTRIETDVVVIAVGVAPNLELAESLELELIQGGIATDETLQAAGGIFAVGDIAAHRHPVYAEHIRVEHWQVAQRQGSAVAAAIVNGAAPYTELPWFWSDQYDLNLQMVGHALHHDKLITRGAIDENKFSAFFVEGEAVQAVLSVNDGKTGRLSRPLIAKHVTVSASALADPISDLRALAET